MKTLTILIIVVIFNLMNLTNLQAQVSQVWVQRYDWQGNEDYTNSIAVDGSGNVYVTGSSVSSVTNADYTTIKYNSTGMQQWIQRYNGPGSGPDNATSIAVDNSGNVYVTGNSFDSVTGSNYATIKYNSTGIEQWVQTYDGPELFDRANSITIDGSANVYVTGYSSGIGTGFDFATIKYNSSGDQQWVRRYDGPGSNYDIPNSIAVDPSGNVYVTGTSTGSDNKFDFATIKYNSSGDQQWVQRYDGAATSIAIDVSGNVYVTGLTQDSAASMDYATIKYNSMGDQLWVKKYNGPGNSVDYAQSIALDGSANVYVTGPSFGIGSSADYATIKYSSIGVEQWIQRYDGPANSSDEAQSLAVDDSGNVYVTGTSSGETSADYATVKYNSTGAEQWVQRYNGPGNQPDRAYDLAVDGSGNVYVTGGSIGKGTNSDYATIKYSQSVGIHLISNEIPKELQLSQNYPNPFNPKTFINYQLPKFTDVKLKVYDILGNEVATLVREKQNAGNYSIEFDAGNLSSGTYFYKIVAGEFVQVKRMIMLK